MRSQPVWDSRGGDEMNEATKGLTYAQVRDTLLVRLGRRGWRLSQALKVPWADSPDGQMRLWFKPQAIWLGKGSDIGNAHSLFTPDYRAVDPELAVEDLLRHVGYRASSLSPASVAPHTWAEADAPLDLTMPLDGDAILILDPYPLADSVNFQLGKGDVPLRVAETWLSRTLSADVKLQHAHGDRFTAWINGSPQQDTVEIKVRMKKKRVARGHHQTHDDPRDLGYNPDSKASPRGFPKLRRINPTRTRR